MNIDQTIIAPAAAPGGGARTILRLSGLAAGEILTQVCLPALEIPHTASVIDVAIKISVPGIGDWPLPLQAWIWPNARSYTRQPLIELHLVGSPPLAEFVLQRFLSAGARLAEPGEFTLRAFLAGRIDLLQAEAVLGVIDAVDHASLQTSLSQLAGGLSQPLHELQNELLNLLADVEAGLDFVDEDISFVSRDELERRLLLVRQQLDQLAQQLTSRATGQRLPRVVLLGAPNAGKSQLFNALTGQTQAIVSPIAGTTRDYLRAEIACDQLPIELIDTAGLMDTNNDSADRSPEESAQWHTQQQWASADLGLYCVEVCWLLTNDSPFPLQQNGSVPLLYVATKSDLLTTTWSDVVWLTCSSTTGQGLAELRSAIASQLQAQPAFGVASTVARCRASLQAVIIALDQAIANARSTISDEWIAADLRTALDELGQVVGTIYTDDLLDRIFSRFCIGK